MEHVFKSLSNEKVVDLIPYLKEKLSASDDIKIYIGTDSQNIGGKTVYASVIVLHYGNRGAHVVYSRMKVERIRERFAKLWKEVEISMEVAQYLREHDINATYIDIDLNPDPRYGSNNVLRAALGFVESFGYVARCKPDAVSASYAADRLCK
jgi:predicted RNase H-related nuclease YkuK (DUF458 family)